MLEPKVLTDLNVARVCSHPPTPPLQEWKVEDVAGAFFLFGRKVAPFFGCVNAVLPRSALRHPADHSLINHRDTLFSSQLFPRASDYLLTLTH